MRKMVIAGSILLLASAVWAGNKINLNVKTGLWQTTTVTTVTGSMGIPPEMEGRLTPAQRARFEAAMKKEASGIPKTRKDKSCLTPEKLAEDPFTDRPHGDNIKCQETIVKSTSTDLEVREACKDGSSSSDIHLTFHADSPEHVTGTSEAVTHVGGRTMTSQTKIDTQWVSSSCPKGVD